MKVIVGMSGGVESSVAAWLLSQQGFQVEGLFMKNWEEDDGTDYCTAITDLEDAQQVCNFIIGVIGPTTARVAFGHTRHSSVLLGVMIGTMRTETSRNNHRKAHRRLLRFAQLYLRIRAHQAGAECRLLQVEDG